MNPAIDKNDMKIVIKDGIVHLMQKEDCYEYHYHQNDISNERTPFEINIFHKLCQILGIDVNSIDATTQMLCLAAIWEPYNETYKKFCEAEGIELNGGHIHIFVERE